MSRFIWCVLAVEKSRFNQPSRYLKISINHRLPIQGLEKQPKFSSLEKTSFFRVFIFSLRNWFRGFWRRKALDVLWKQIDWSQFHYKKMWFFLSFSFFFKKNTNPLKIFSPKKPWTTLCFLLLSWFCCPWLSIDWAELMDWRGRAAIFHI